MADSELTILIKARNEAKAEFDKLDKQVKGLQGSTGQTTKSFKALGDALTGDKLSSVSKDFEQIAGMSAGAALGIGAVATALLLVGKYAANAMSSFEDYAFAVKDMSVITDDSAENTSRLIDAANDLRIETESLQQALTIANKNGFDTSLISLKAMADEYVSLGTAVEKTQFLFNRFGRSGQDLAKLFEGGSAGITEYTDSVLKANIVTEKMIEDAEKFKDVKNNLDDVNEAMKNSIGRVAMEGWTQVLLGIKVLFYGYSDAADTATESTDNLTASVEDAAAASLALSSTFDDLKTIMGGAFGKENAKFTESMEDLTKEAGDLQSQIDELEGKKYLTEAQKKQLGELRTQLGEVTGAMDALALSHELAMKEMAMNMIMQKAASDGLTTNEVSNIATIMKAWGLWDEQTANMVEFMNGLNLDTSAIDASGLWNQIALITGEPQTIKFDAETTPQLDKILELAGGGGAGLDTPVIDIDTYQAEIKSQKLIDRLNEIKDRTATVTIDFNISGGIGAAEKALHIDLNGNGIIGAANGADFTVPPGYPNDSMLMGVTSGEHVKVTPAGKNGGGATVIVNYSPALSLSSKTEAETVLVPLIRQALARGGV